MSDKRQELVDAKIEAFDKLVIPPGKSVPEFMRYCLVHHCSHLSASECIQLANDYMTNGYVEIPGKQLAWGEKPQPVLPQPEPESAEE